jgi:PhzF family phenazine biosynthesis protein
MMSQTMRIVQVDAFTDRAFGGNPAAVCVLPGPADDGWMQRVALEMNLSETVYVHREGADAWRLRWFTPVAEVDLCGHATLATAHAMWEGGALAEGEPARFETRSGRLTATRGADGWIELDFPAEPARVVELSESERAAVGVPTRCAGRNRMDLLVELADAAAVRSYRPDFGRLAEVPARGVIVTARGESGTGYDFLSRFFAPRLGVPEDPVCGSAHCALAPYWAERLGKTTLLAYQASERGGVLRLRVSGDRVALAGQAVTTLRGELLGAAGAWEPRPATGTVGGGAGG